ncbi:MAG: hypothetical protein ACTSPY_04255 [Candidatus Helarchaeota archaeon]
MINDKTKSDVFITTRDKGEISDEGASPIPQRIGRRESEPHSEEVSYMYDVLTTNFPGSRTFWDLHHYFKLSEDDSEIDIQFDISFCKDFILDKAISSYNPDQFNGRIPDIAINILSKSTWRIDLLEHVEYCEKIKIPYYIVFTPYDTVGKLYRPPFMRIFHLENNKYVHFDVRDIVLKEGEEENIDNTKIINLGNKLPFRIGLMERKKSHIKCGKLYRLVFFDKEKDIILKTNAEKEKERAEKEKERAEKEKKRADQLEKILEKYKQKFGEIN